MSGAEYEQTPVKFLARWKKRVGVYDAAAFEREFVALVAIYLEGNPPKESMNARRCRHRIERAVGVIERAVVAAHREGSDHE